MLVEETELSSQPGIMKTSFFLKKLGILLVRFVHVCEHVFACVIHLTLKQPENLPENLVSSSHNEVSYAKCVSELEQQWRSVELVLPFC